jgi:hypothetical protein
MAGQQIQVKRLQQKAYLRVIKQSHGKLLQDVLRDNKKQFYSFARRVISIGARFLRFSDAYQLPNLVLK